VRGPPIHHDATGAATGAFIGVTTGTAPRSYVGVQPGAATGGAPGVSIGAQRALRPLLPPVFTPM